ncbi:HXXEE domain-containing protein [Sediminimonas qiaohouensis]|uniref:HXXEE domain-containing protein n=1 Tax=Sediminimonas qiaohouensis TaxID=552061 RepID=UPI00235580C9|nr:HXXEE domain-containing protein [Sediminimonas qiaohouensis]
MSTEALIWLFPVVFIIHDFEEIIMGPPWLRQHGDTVVGRFPFTATVVARIRGVTASGFAMMVLVMFSLVVAITLISAQFELFNLWAGAVTVFLLHFIVHFGQFLVYRAYVPVIVTSVPGAIWCVVALKSLWERGLLDAAQTGQWTLMVAAGAAIWFFAAHKIGAWFDIWLRKTFPAAF